jgi:signal recognition particle subunit SRP54
MFENITQRISQIFNQIKSNKDAEKAKQQLEQALIEADVPFELASNIITKVDAQLGSSRQPKLSFSEFFAHSVYNVLVEELGGKTTATYNFSIPSIILMVGLQGSGKTSTIGKLGYYLKKQAAAHGKKRTILAASVDFNRPAAQEQLGIVAEQAGIQFYKATEQKDPVKAAKEIVAYAKNQGIEYLFIDTAGRLHVQNELLQELVNIQSAIKPQHSLLVLDGLLGQESLNIAKIFAAKIAIQAGIITKLDSNTRAGVIVGFSSIVQKKIAFIAHGEKIEDLSPFYPDRLAQRIIGLGDLQTLLEKAQEKIQQNEQDTLKDPFSGSFTLDDFRKHLGMVNKLGSLGSIMKMMPGFSSQQISPEALSQSERELKKFSAIIDSMTRKERLYPKILNSSRIHRIEKGAGVTAADVRSLIEKFEQTQHFAKLFKKSSLMQRMFK